MIAKVCLQIPSPPSYLLLKNIMLAFTHLLSFCRRDSIIYAWHWSSQRTRFLCNITSEVSCKCFPVLDDKIKVAFVREGLWQKKTGFRKKEIIILISPKFVTLLNQADCLRFVWYYIATIKNEIWLGSFSFIFFIYSWLELLHFVIIVSIYIMMVNSVLHWKWKANWRQLNCNDLIR